MKKAFITGVTGQDGSYLSEFLLKKGYEVHGLIRRSSSYNRGRINHIINYKNEAGERKFFLHYGDMTDSTTIMGLISDIKPDEIYNLAAQSHVKVSFEIPEYTSISDGIGVLKILEAVRSSKLINTKIYQASTSELYGDVFETPQKETTPFNPLSPYAVAKQYGHYIIKSYRESYNMFACCGILFNHESERRGENFVTRKITRTVAAIKHGIQKKIILGNMNAIRDWGYAPDYVEAMWLMLQKEKPEDYVIATGKGKSVKQFVEESFKHIGRKITWKGEGVSEKGIDADTNEILVEVDPKYFRPNEVNLLIGDSQKAKTELNWAPKVGFEELVSKMMKHDLEEIRKSNSLEFN